MQEVHLLDGDAGHLDGHEGSVVAVYGTKKGEWKGEMWHKESTEAMKLIVKPMEASHSYTKVRL